MFDIPIPSNTKGALSMDALMNGNMNPGAPAPQNQSMNQPIQNAPQMASQGFNQQPMSQPYQQPQMTPQAPQMPQQQPYNPQPQMQYQQPPMQTPQPQMQQPQMNAAPVFTNTPRPPQGKGVSLKKGQKLSLTKTCPGLDMVDIGLGWDVCTNSGIPYDLDAEIFALGADGKVLSDDWFIFYNQPNSPDGSINHLGDNRTGNAVGDDETISVQLSRVNPQVQKIAVVISINEAFERRHNFGGVQNAYVRLINKANNEEICRYNLTDYYKEVTSMTVCELYRNNGEWKLNPVGQGLNTDLAGLCQFYGVNLDG